MWPEWFWFFLVMLAFFAGMLAQYLIEREIDEEVKASDGVFLGSMCGCMVSVRGRFYGILYCPKHEAAPEMYEALKELSRVYHTGDFETEFRPALQQAQVALALADGSDA